MGDLTLLKHPCYIIELLLPDSDRHSCQTCSIRLVHHLHDRILIAELNHILDLRPIHIEVQGPSLLGRIPIFALWMYLRPGRKSGTARFGVDDQVRHDIVYELRYLDVLREHSVKACRVDRGVGRHPKGLRYGFGKHMTGAVWCYVAIDERDIVVGYALFEG